MAEPAITEDDLDILTPADEAAVAARERWVTQAGADNRAYKQIPPEGDWDQLIFKSGRGFGKLVSLETEIPTPTGWTTMGMLRVGDEVFDERGQPCVVTGKYYPPVTQAYRMTFSDGSIIEADADHQWVTWTHRDRKQYLRHGTKIDFPPDWATWRGHIHRGGRSTKGTVIGSFGAEVRTTEQIRATLTHSARRDTNHCIPLAGALQLPHARLPVDPWVLGYWLGNGSTGSGHITSGSHKGQMDSGHVCAQIRAAGLEVRCTDNPLRGSSSVRPIGLERHLEEALVLDQKHVPSIYLRASEPQRLALLRGLLDSDGYASKSSVEFCSTQRILAEAVYELVVSLSERCVFSEGRATLDGRDMGPKYRVTWRPSRYNPFSLPRKAALVGEIGAQGLRMRHRMIDNIEPIPAKPMACISVDSPSRMYLVGRAMIPTHNTRAETEWMFWEGWRLGGSFGPALRFHAVAPTIGDVRGTIFEGPSGFQSVIPAECLRGGSWNTAFSSSQPGGFLHLANGTIIRGFGVKEQGARLRGPQCHALIGDELREWDHPPGNLEKSYDNMMYGLRLPWPDGSSCRAVLGTTPKAIPFLKKLYKMPGVKVVTGSTYENEKNLDAAFRRRILTKEGTKSGRVEIYAEDIEADEDGIFKKHWIRVWPKGKKLPEFVYIVMSLDTAFETEHQDPKGGKDPDYSACSIWGLFNVAQVFPDEKERRNKYQITNKYAALLCDFWMERLAYPDLLEKARQTYRVKWGSPGRRADLVLIENKASGISLRQSLSKYGVPTWPFNPRGQSKTMRANAASPFVLQGALWMPESGLDHRAGEFRDWCDPLVEQMTTFSGEGSIEFDDGLDTATQFVIAMHERGYFEVKPQTRLAPDPDEKIDAEHAEAVRQAQAEKRRTRGNPYGM